MEEYLTSESVHKSLMHMRFHLASHTKQQRCNRKTTKMSKKYIICKFSINSTANQSRRTRPTRFKQLYKKKLVHGSFLGELQVCHHVS
jgi:hypothetical protein